jgi:hypothetical protein
VRCCGVALEEGPAFALGLGQVGAEALALRLDRAGMGLAPVRQPRRRQARTAPLDGSGTCRPLALAASSHAPIASSTSASASCGVSPSAEQYAKSGTSATHEPSSSRGPPKALSDDGCTRSELPERWRRRAESNRCRGLCRPLLLGFYAGPS